MSEVTLDLRHIPKDRAYAQLRAHVIGVLGGMDDDIAAMSTMSALIHHAFGHLWTGFYRVVGPELLRIGPYQGMVGCLEIAFGRGVCGTAAGERRTIVVPDVDRYPGHISCDARSKSEVVVPVLDRSGALIAVLDVN
jgi:L-methionine (R)-S-oxide reductase